MYLKTVRNQFHQKSSWVADEYQACQNHPDKEAEGLVSQWGMICNTLVL